jgi:hypothetical protein
MEGEWSMSENENGAADTNTFGENEESSKADTGDDLPVENYIHSTAQNDQSCWQSHVHEYQGSTELSLDSPHTHNHRFAGISGEAIYVPGSHVHRLASSTDFFDHYHEIHVISGPATFLTDCSAKKSDRKHVHMAEGATSSVDCHRHMFTAVTLIEAPLIGENKDSRES